ncbi:MAG TPA: hypothetical protein VLG76_06290 [Rhabdochlamydiaceae bacterium]|nr:hypothetical protein [Rhabdochlamydiaceae bacterium]
MSIIASSKEHTIYSMSLSCYLYAEIERLDEDLEKASFAKKAFVYTACELGFLCSTLIGTVETLFWLSIALLFKIPHALIPKSHSSGADKVYAQIIANLCGTATGLSSASVMSIMNYFTDNPSMRDTLIKIRNAVPNALEKCSNIISYHFY